MYSIYDKESAINQVLRYLNLSENGIYSEKARSAVRLHQRNNGIEENGIVDFITFNSLYNDYKISQNKKNAGQGILTDKTFPYSFGNQGTDVSIINAMLSDVLEDYTYFGYVPRGSYFSRDTADAVKMLSKVFGLSERDAVDEEFFERLRFERDNKNSSFK